MKPPRRAAFLKEYLFDLNATPAAIRPGYRKRTARQQAAALLCAKRTGLYLGDSALNRPSSTLPKEALGAEMRLRRHVNRQFRTNAQVPG
jgi:hypothetical protein